MKNVHKEKIVMTAKYTVRDDKKIRVIIDTDAACEADDQYAIAHSLMTPKFIIKGITAEHFGEKPEGSTEQKSYEEIIKILSLMHKENVPVYHGEPHAINSENFISNAEAVDFIIKEAMTESKYPLFVFCQGAVTNVACALIKNPEIAKHMTIISIIGAPYPKGGWEFNLTNDWRAANVLFASGAEVWQVPMNCYAKMRVSYAELQQKVLPCGEIGKYLFEEMQTYAISERGNWCMGESWSLGDSPVVGLCIDECIGNYESHFAPVFDKDGNYIDVNSNKIRVYESIDSRFILEDFFAKLSIFYKK